VFAYLFRVLCWDKYLMRTSSFYLPVPTRKQVWLREAGLKVRKIGGSDAWAKHSIEKETKILTSEGDIKRNVFIGNN
jgi:hypothetical protein